MSNITITHLYERVASTFGKETAENVSSFIDFKITEEMNNHLRVLATKQEMTEGFALAKQDLTEGLAAVRQEMTEGFALAKQDLNDGLAKAKLDLTEGLAKAKLDLTEGLAAVRQELAQGLAAVRQEMGSFEVRLTEKIVGSKAEIIKWMFVFWVSQFLAMIGYLQFFVKK